MKTISISCFSVYHVSVTAASDFTLRYLIQRETRIRLALEAVKVKAFKVLGQFLLTPLPPPLTPHPPLVNHKLLRG